MNILNYTTTEKIYDSGNSLVYRAINYKNNQPVILKILKENYPTPEELTRYRQEYEIICRLNGLNLARIIKAYRIEKYQNTLLMCLEDFGGQSLKTLQMQRTFTFEALLQFAIQISETLGYIHQYNIIHKDINPSNLILNLDTDMLKIIDFGISTQLSKQHLTLKNPEVLEGTLAYMSPEQTGRMNRALDYRTDFYSLGATFYELFTGKPPFESQDAMELVHCHIAKQPVLPHEINPELPQVVSEIIMKLLAKTAEARYLSAWGIKADFEKCQLQLENTRKIEGFILAQQDISDRFQILQKLYGRESEVETLLNAFERVAAGTTEMMLVAGYSGIGKSVLVKEIYKSLTEKQGYFITGKFDQYQRNIPYSAVVSAFGELVRQLLTENKDKLARWKEKLLSALGSNGQVIIDVIPEIELILGKQPLVPQLDPSESQNRFNRIFQNFIQVFCQPEHPLVIFLDDLQWGDLATLRLLELVMPSQSNEALFLIGAYRDNEVTTAHPLITTLNQLREEAVLINQITLKPLAFEHINQLTADSLQQDLTTVNSLTDLVMRKTNGNPFFVNQFLKTLHEESLLHFVAPTVEQKPYWKWNIAQIEAMNITDNVVDLMVGKLKKLPEATQQILHLAACVGNRFDLDTLAVIYEKPIADTFQDLTLALNEVFILPISSLEIAGKEIHISPLAIRHFHFLHDRVQQAAYALIDDEQKQTVHLQIGRLLLKNATSKALEDKIFDIVGHFSHSLELLDDQEEQICVVELFLLAGQKAKMATAYEAANNYLIIAQNFLTPTSWEEHYDLSLNLSSEAVEVAYLRGDFEEMEQKVQIVLEYALTLSDKAKAYETQILAYAAQHQYHKAIDKALVFLKQVGVILLEDPTQEEVSLALQHLQTVLSDHPTHTLIDLPIMQDTHKILAMRIMTVVFSSAYHIQPNMMIQIIGKQIELSLEYGNISESSFAYVCHGFILCVNLGEIESGYQFGQLALNLVKKLGEKWLEVRVVHMFNVFIRIWKEHTKVSLQNLLRNYQLGLENGNMEFAAYSIHVYSYYSYLVGKPLYIVNEEIVRHNRTARLKQESGVFERNNLHWQIVLNLMEKVDNPSSLEGEIYDEKIQLLQHQKVNDKTEICNFHFNKCILHYLFQDYAAAFENAEIAECYLDGITGLLQIALLVFYESLSRLAIYPTLSQTAQEAILTKVSNNQERMQNWVKHAPMNFQHKYDLVEAEKARVLGQWEAIGWYEKAITGAKENEYLNEEALAYELTARFYLERGMNKVAQVYLQDAYYAYQRWGAKAKVKDLETKYPQLLSAKKSKSQSTDVTLLATQVTTSSTSGGSQWLDLSSVMKASQTLSGEIVLSHLLEKMMRIVIENAGAEKGFLLLPKGEQWFIEAEGNVNRSEIKILQSLQLEDSQDVANTLVFYVVRTLENVVLNHACQEGNFIRDPHIAQEKTKSLLAMPLLNQGKLVGILYLENNLVEGAFTTNRIETLKMLSSQIAISIQNAKLYAEVQENEKTLRQFLEAIPVGIGIIDNLGKPYFVNQRGQELLGCGLLQDTETHQIAENYELYVAETDQLYPSEKLPIVRALQGKSTNVENIEIHQHNKIIPLESWGAPIFDDQNNVLYAMSAFQDISERKQAEINKIRLVQEQEAKNVALRYSAEIEEKNTELAKTLTQLKETQSQLVESEKMASLGNLVAGVAHEINTPVGVGVTAASQLDKVTIDFANLYKEGKMTRVDLEQYLNAMHQTGGLILKNLTRAAELTQSFKQVAVDQASERQRTFVLLDYINEILFSLKPKFKSTNYQISVDCDAMITLKTYAGAFSQVMTNLIMNSMKHGFAECKEGQIKIAVIEEVEQLMIHYSDDGKGIASENIDKIFEPFFTTNRQGGGTGLGLHIAYNLVTHKLKGSIQCQSELGKGVLFTLNLPLT